MMILLILTKMIHWDTSNLLGISSKLILFVSTQHFIHLSVHAICRPCPLLHTRAVANIFEKHHISHTPKLHLTELRSTELSPKKTWSDKILVRKNIALKKTFGQKICLEKFWSEEKKLSEKILVRKFFWSKFFLGVGNHFWLDFF